MKIFTKKTVSAGKPGTKKWIKKFGHKLICVRYKYDIENKRKIKTVELEVENQAWELDVNRIPANKLTRLKVDYGEIHVGKVIRAAGGRWDKKNKYWELPYREVVALGLEDRII
jgi:hypothetical protein